MKQLPRIVAAALLAALVLAHVALVASCVSGPERVAPRPSAPAIVDEKTADLAHKVEQQKIEEALQQRIAEIKAHQEEVQRSIQSWAYGLGLGMAALGILLAVVGFWFKAVQPIGFALFVSGFLTIVFAKAVSDWGDSMSAIVAIGLCCALLGGLWYAVVALRTYMRASKDMVKAVEKTKAVLPPDEAARAFGSGGIASRIYAPSTKRLVARLRTNLERKSSWKVSPASPPPSSPTPEQPS